MKKKIGIKLNRNGNYLSIPDTEDWKFDSGDFTICGFCYINKKGKLIIKDCSCKCGKKCKGFIKIKRK